MPHLGGRYLTEVELADAGFRRLGRNIRIHERASIYCTENIVLWDNVRIDDFTVVIATGGVEFRSYSYLSAGCYIGGTNGILFGEFTTLAPQVKLFSSSDDYSGGSLTNEVVPQRYVERDRGKIVLGKHVIIGAGSVVLPGCELGDGASIGSLSLVNRSLEPWGIYAGVPVRRLKARQQRVLELEARVRQEETGQG
ncbi:MAG: acyltransferase [Magnetococcales bacterium]|nr:acyltransferase [Magnetococcales bacterium]MBF0155709.1 acyltransferase [Magnetococcales bacterium]